MATVFEIELDLATKADPFVPFSLVLSGGIRYAVNSPYMVVSRDTVIDHFPFGSDDRNLLRTNQLAAIEFTPVAERHSAI